MRWTTLCWGLPLLLTAAVGCKQPVFMTKPDIDHVDKDLLPDALAYKPASVQPVIGPRGEPPTPYSPDRPIRYMSLAEAIAIALETGRVGNQQVLFLETSVSNAAQTYTDQPSTFQRQAGGAVGPSDSIRVLRLDPAIIGANIEASLSKFDAVFQTSLAYTGTDRPVGTSLDVFETGSSGVSTIIQQQAVFTTDFVKPLPTGGVVQVTFSNTYERTNLPAAVNPSYTPDLQFSFEQPLLQGFGVEINQIRAAHPGSILNPGAFNGSPTAEGILITRIRFDQQRAEFERNVQIMVANVEIQYWNVYNAYWNLYAQEQGLRQSFEAWRILSAKLAAGTAKIADLAQTRGQYENFRASRLTALQDVLDQERSLRGLLGLPSEDGTRIVPSDQPTLAPFRPNWELSWQEAMALRPELVEAREEVKAAQLNLIAAKDTLKPDLRFFATYDVNSIGPRLDGAAPLNALESMTSDHFNNYTIGLRGSIPLGYRLANTNVRIAELQVSRAFQTVIDNEEKIDLFLRQQYLRVFVNYELIKINRSARESFAQQLAARNQELLAGRITTDVLLEAQRFFAAALAAEYQSIRDYNNTLVAFEFAKGTILQRNNVVISEGALPGFAQQRAVEHLKERSDALTLRTHAAATLTTATDPALAVPAPTSQMGTMSIQDLWKTNPPLKDVPQLPDPAMMPMTVPGASTTPGLTPMPTTTTGAQTIPPAPPIPMPPVTTLGTPGSPYAPGSVAPPAPPIPGDFATQRLGPPSLTDLTPPPASRPPTP